nr:MAG TPA: hypothetical protein [Caudoviricetes sp.]
MLIERLAWQLIFLCLMLKILKLFTNFQQEILMYLTG